VVGVLTLVQQLRSGKFDCVHVSPGRNIVDPEECWDEGEPLKDLNFRMGGARAAELRSTLRR